MSGEQVVCSNSACTVSETGRCVEGLELSACPNYGHTSAAEEALAEVAGSGVEAQIELSPSRVLDPSECSRLLAARLSRVVAIVGTFGAGKTSIIAGIYDAFQRGPVADFSFAGSSTLHSFEVTCHDSRSASRRPDAEIFRTPRGEARFYHVDLRHKHETEVTSLLIADRAGEEYLIVASEAAAADPLFEVRRADTVTALVDGARLSTAAERHNVKAEVESMLQGMADGGILSGQQRLAVVLTKRDVVVDSGRSQQTEADFDRLIDGLRRNMSASFHEIEAFRTAASPKTPGAVRGEGLADLLKYWMRPTYVPTVLPVAIAPERDFGRLREVET